MANRKKNLGFDPGPSQGKASLTREVATAARDWTHPLYLGIAQTYDPVLFSQGGVMALQAYRDLERDTHVHAILQKRKFAVVGRPWEVLPASDSPLDKKAADLVEAQLKGLGFDKLCLGLLDAQLMGFSVAEILWAVRGGQLWAAQAIMRRQERFIFKTLDQGAKGAQDPWVMRLRTLTAPLDGDELPDRKFIVHRTGSFDNNPYGMGLGNQLYWPVEFKRQGLTFWLIFADKFGSPTVVGKYEPGATDTEKQELLNAALSVSTDGAIIHPVGMEMELLEAARAGSIDTYDKLCRYMDEQMSEAVLGETGSTNQHGSGGSRARDQVGNEVRLEVAQADADLLSATLQDTLIRWIVELNLPGAGLPSVWRSFEEPEDLKNRAERDGILFDMGFRPTLETITEVYGEGYEDMGPPAPPTPKVPGLPQPSLELAEGDGTDAADRITAQAISKAGRGYNAMLAPIKKAIQASTSLLDLRDRLETLYPELDSHAFAEVMEQAMVLASLEGRHDVLSGA